MPAGSDPGLDVPPLPQVWRPLGPRVVGIVLGAALLVVFGFAWFGLTDRARAGFTPFQIGTVIFLLGLGVGCIHAIVRSKVEATTEALVVVNGYKRRRYDWAQVIGVHLPPGAPWVTLDLTDGSTVSAMGIQGSDGARARAAARDLRALVEARSA